MRYLLLILSFVSFSCFSQKCWECIVAAKNFDQEKALDICRNVTNASPEENEVVQFLIGKMTLNEKKYLSAISHFEKVLSTQDTLLQSLVNGLIGDCYLELGDYSKALIAYQTATKYAEHTNFEVYFLTKQGFCHAFLKNIDEHKKISALLRVKDRFQSSPFSYRHIEDCSEYDSISKSTMKIIEGPYGVGVYKGKKIDNAEFIEKKDYLYQDMKEAAWEPSYPDQKRIEEDAWQYMILMEQLNQHRKGLALTLSDQEFWAYLFGENGYNLNPTIEVSFKDDDGIFRKDWLLNRVTELEREDNSLWKDTKKALKEMAELEKLNFLTEQGIYVSTIEHNDFVAAKNEHLVVESVELYHEYGQLDQKVDPNEIKAYYEKNKFSPDYTYEAERHLEIILVPLSFSAKDSTALVEELTALKNEFKNSSSDSLFVEQNSLTKRTNYITYRLDQHGSLQPLFKKAKVGDVVGPFWEEDMLSIAKVGGFSKFVVSARHILIASSSFDKKEKIEEKRKLATSILKQINQSNFEEFVQTYTNDPGSKLNGGVYSDFIPEMMVESFANYCSNAKIGKIGMIESQYGFHIVEVLERKKVKFPKLLFVRKELTTSQEVIDREKAELQNKMNQLDNQFQKITSYEDKIEFCQDLPINDNHAIQTHKIKERYPTLNSFGELEEELLRFAYTNTPFSVGKVMYDEINNQLIVPILTGIFSGEPNFEQVYKMAKIHCQQEKISDSISNLLKDYTDIQEVADFLGLEAVTDTYARNHPRSYNITSKLAIYPQNFPLLPKVMNEIQQQDLDKILFIKNPWGLFIGKIIAQEIPEEIPEEEEDQTYLLNYWKQQIMRTVESFSDGKTVFNYPLFRLNLRE